MPEWLPILREIGFVFALLRGSGKLLHVFDLAGSQQYMSIRADILPKTGIH